MGALDILGERPDSTASALSLLGDAGNVPRETLAPAPNPAMALLQAPTTATPFGMVSPANVLAQLPTAGMMAGGALGGPELAGVGGGAGEAARQGLASLLTGSNQMNTEGVDKAVATGALSEAGGRGAGKLLKGAAKGIMALAARSSPEVAQTALEEGVTATRGGLQKLSNRIGQVGAEARAQVIRMTRQGVRIDPHVMANDVLGQFNDLFAGGQAIVSDDARKLLTMTDKFLSDHPGKITPKILYRIKQTSDELAAGVRRTVDSGGHVPFADQLEGRWHKAMADWARSRLHLDPSLQAKDQLLSKLLDLKDAMFPVVKKSRPFAERLVTPIAQRGAAAGIGATIGSSLPGDRLQHGLEGAAAGALLGSPGALSNAALAMNSPLWQALFAQAPRVSTAVQQQAGR